MNFSISHKSADTIDSGIVSIFLFQGDDIKKRLSELPINLQNKINSILTLQEFKGELKEKITFYSDSGTSSPRFTIIGMGKKENLSNEILRRVASLAILEAQKLNSKSIAYYFPQLDEMNLKIELISQSLVEGIKLGYYNYEKYKTKKNNKIETVTFLIDDKSDVVKFQNGIVKGEIISDAVIIARNLGNAPGNEIYPKTLADEVVKISKIAKFKVKVLNEREILKLKMNGVISVCKGSTNPPRFLILEHGTKYRSKKTIAFVGKGVTFDTGGISIKPSAAMSEMKMDMSGAAAVIGSFYAIAKLNLPIHVVGLIPAVENMPSGNALKPGDIIRHFNGKTSEVDNTDAEGRLILADALSFASKYKPEVVIDLATLTGACVVALGQHASGLMGNDKNLNAELLKIGDETFERLCELPLYKEYEKQIKSDVADVKNVGGKWAGAITAALFLKEFIGDYKWAHLDIAGPAILESNFDYAKKGASGVGVMLLTKFAEDWK